MLFAAIVWLSSSVASAAPTAALTWAERDNLVHNTLGMLGIAPSMRGVLLLQMCREQYRCAGSCAAMIGAMVEHRQPTAEEASSCKELARLAQLPETKQPVEVERWAGARLRGFVESIAATLDPYERRVIPCNLFQIGVMPRPVDPTCKKYEAEPDSKAKAPWGSVEAGQYRNRRANIVGLIPSGYIAKVTLGGDAVELRGTEDTELRFPFVGWPIAPDEIAHQVTPGRLRVSRELQEPLGGAQGSDLPIEAVRVPLGNGRRSGVSFGTEPLSRELHVAYLSVCDGRAHAVFILCGPRSASPVLDRWMSSFAQKGTCDATATSGY